MNSQAGPGWYGDPFGRHEARYWDGARWTHHVGSHGRQLLDAPVVGPPQTSAGAGSSRIQRDVRRAGVSVGSQAGGGTLLTEPVLVISQKAKLVELNAEYAVHDQHGRKIGVVREVGQGLMKRAVATRPPDKRTRRLQVVDVNGRVLLTLTRPATVIRSTVVVRDPLGVEIGQIVQKNFGIVGKVRFDLESRGQTIGSLNAEGWDAWDFSIQDSTGDEVARISKTWAGMAKEWFTKSDSYVVQVNRPSPEPLRSLVAAAALAVDTALRQGGSSARRRR